MGTRTKIEWCDATWNPVVGCSKVSAGCTNCYAERVSHRFRWTTKPWNAAYAAENVRLHPERLEDPLRWRKPKRVFVCSMADLFHEQVPNEFITRVFAAIALAPVKHTFLILTKRPNRMRDFILNLPNISDTFRLWVHGGGEWPLSNVWLGVSVENQQAADERIPVLLQTPAAVRFVSCEPLLGSVDLCGVTLEEWDDGGICVDALTGEMWMMDGFERELEQLPRIDWVIVGGETGPGARPMNPDWLTSLLHQCKLAKVPFFFKQWGEWAPVHELRCNEPGIRERQWYNFDPDTAVCRIGKKASGRMLDGREWNDMPPVNKEA